MGATLRVVQYRTPHYQCEFDIDLLCALTSTCFESTAPFDEGDRRPYSDSRDERSDYVQIVIALVVTPEGLPLACEVRRRVGSSDSNTEDAPSARPWRDQQNETYLPPAISSSLVLPV
ncbi:MAG: hypothetical protein JWQ90_1198 [Hydrocarboniphaga sp.]|uniref:hypothetical protein n=1 Tax=Hydrocarboniphaga sp. TaxID=2033016 RepID=UPI0026107682|nr:hypothetical protein [Hydrocarboniphaga sp.]MDB5968748.1 hypothetical protein [Hydrocarboniphaga sp.]